MQISYLTKGTNVNWGESYHAMAISQSSYISSISNVMEHDSIIRISTHFKDDGYAENVDEKEVSSHLIDDEMSGSFFVDFILYSTQGHYLIGYVGHFDTFGV